MKLTADKIKEMVLKAIGRVMETDHPGTYNMGWFKDQEEGCDDLDTIEIIMTIESYLKVQIPNEVVEKLEYTGDGNHWAEVLSVELLK